MEGADSGFKAVGPQREWFSRSTRTPPERHGGRDHFPIDVICLSDVAATWVIGASSFSSGPVCDNDFHRNVQFVPSETIDILTRY